MLGPESPIIVPMPSGGDGPTAPMRHRLISPRDIALLIYLAVLLVPAWLLPERALMFVGNLIARSSMRLNPDRTGQQTARLQSLFGARLRTPAATLHAAIVANTHIHNMMYLRALRPGGWRPSIRLIGAEHIRRALDGERGVVIWAAPLVYSHLLTKMALASVGLKAAHLSHISHNLSGTRFGLRFLNGFVRAVENKYLVDRFVMQLDNRTDALRKVRQWVDRNGVVTITALGGSAGRTFTIPFFDGTLELPTGAPELARRTGALLAIALTIREPDGSFVTRIEPLNDPSAEEPRSDLIREAAVAFASTVAATINSRPDQCSPTVYLLR